MWECDVFQALLDIPRVHDVDFQACMHIGSRDKWTRLHTNVPGLQSLSAQCDRLHAHEPWGVKLPDGHAHGFHTAEKCAYPALLCTRLARAVRVAVTAKWGPPEPASGAREPRDPATQPPDHVADLRDRRARTRVRSRNGTQVLIRGEACSSGG